MIGFNQITNGKRHLTQIKSISFNGKGIALLNSMEV